MNNQSRLVSAFGLIFSLIVSLISPALLPLSVSAQEENKTAKQESKKKEKSKKTNKDTSPSPTNSASGDAKSRPLSANEDPSQIGKRNINKGFTGWLGGSKEKEIAIGRQVAAEVEQQAKILDDPLVTEYVNRVGQNIPLYSDVKVPVTIKVIDSDEVNAFALPDGFLFVNKGLILAADNESELAGVMAHELGHVAARHAMENQGKAQLINYGMLAGVIFGGGIVSPILYNGGGLLQGLIGLKFSRQAEEEADRLGEQYLYAAGYDPTAMSTMFEKLAAQNKKKTKGVAKLLMSHPDSLERRDSTLALVARFPEREEYVISTSEFQRVKAHLLRLSNAKDTVISDIDDNEPGKPTLKRRQPESDDADDTTTEGSSSSDTPPQLKRRGESQPSPTSKPNQ